MLDASPNPKPSTKHEWPIFLDKRDYAAKVGSKTAANIKGPLRHLTQGVAVIEAWQPYNGKGNPASDPLWAVHRFSNADKHRQLAVFGLVPSGAINIAYNGIVVEENMLDEVADWKPDQELPLGRIRFDPPRAYNLRAQGRVRVTPIFIAPKFGQEDELAMRLDVVDLVVKRVAEVVDSFRHL